MRGRRPPFVLLENVLGMMNSREGLDFKICLERLGGAGYTVDPFVLDAKWFVPQSRPRLFVLAIRDDLHKPGHLGGESAVTSILRPRRLVEFIKAHPDLPWSLRTLPAPAQVAPALARVLEKLPETDARWWSAARTAQLHKQMSAQHRAIVQDWCSKTKCSYGTVFRRMRHGQSMAELRTDGIAGCLRTPKGGSARQILFRVSNGTYAARLLTPRECARLMGADETAIPEALSVNKALFAFGDGVCVPVIRWIAENYLTPLAAELIRGRLLLGIN
jgi:DNA (cytosine-5)-methyltransferase 1